MPYASDAQRRYFHYLESKGKMPKKTVDEFDDESEDMDMPDHVKRKMAFGGRILESDEDYSDSPMPDMPEQEDSDSGDEPPYVQGFRRPYIQSYTGAPKMYAEGGRVEDPMSMPRRDERDFHKALRRHYRKGSY